MPAPISFDELVLNNPEVSRLLTAAVINQNFRRLLLADPAAAIKSGFNGENFLLAPHLKDHIVSIRARTLADFASQILKTPQEQSHPHISPVPSYGRLSISAGLD